MSGMQLYQLKDYIGRTKIGTQPAEKLGNWFDLLHDKFDKPLDVDLTGAVLTIEAGTKQKLESDGLGSVQNSYKWRLPPIAGQNIDPAESTFNFSTGAVTADMVVENAPTMTAGWYVQMGIELREDGKFYTVWGEQAATPGATGFPRFNDDASGIIWVTLQDDGTGGMWNFVTPGRADLYVMGSVGSGGGGGGDTSFRLKDAGGTEVNIVKGYWKVRGMTLVVGNPTESGGLVSMVKDLDNILAAPAAAGDYQLYIDTSALGDPVSFTDNGRPVYQVFEDTHFKLLPQATYANPMRYVDLGGIKAPGGSTWDGKETYYSAPRLHEYFSHFMSYPEEKRDMATAASTKVVDYTDRLTSRPMMMALEFHDESESEDTPINPQGYVTNITDSQVEFDFSGLTMDAGDYVSILLINIPRLANGIVKDSHVYESPWWTSSPGPSVAHGLTDKNDIKSVVVLREEIATGRQSILTLSTPVKEWDDDNIYFNWIASFDFSTYKFRVLTSPTTMPQAFRPALKNKHEFTATGQLTAVTTAYPLDITDEDEIHDIRCLQKIGGKWQTIYPSGKVYVEDDTGVFYLRGNIDSEVPSGTNPIRVVVNGKAELINAALPATQSTAGSMSAVEQDFGGPKHFHDRVNFDWVIKTANYTASKGERVLADTSGGPWELTLPANPQRGWHVEVADMVGTFHTDNLTLKRNGQRIQGLENDLPLTLEGMKLIAVFSDAANGWRIFR